ncbi:MAG: hypothetical protein M1299_01175 [Firmicutes bacterium]|nr:hypothetical protein [Bacillota bacterium]MCL5038436.1 hypothetical protein [Bacillota bacterium]
MAIAIAIRLSLLEARRSTRRILLLTVGLLVCLLVFSIYGAILDDLADQAKASWRTVFPYDIQVLGTGSISREAATKVPGIREAEKYYYIKAFLGSRLIQVITTPSESRIFSLEMAEGKIPQTAEEIALPLTMAMTMGLKTGDELQLLRAGAKDPVRYVISGLLQNRQGVPTFPIITREGLRRSFAVSTILDESLFICLDGKASVAEVKDLLGKIFPQAEIKSSDDQYEDVRTATGLAELLIQGIRLTLLIAASAAFAAITVLAIEDRRFEIGVIRTLGMNAYSVLIFFFLQAIVVLMLAVPAAFAVSWLFNGHLPFAPVRLHHEDLLSGAKAFCGVIGAISLWSSLLFSRRPPATLLRQG